MAIPRIHLFEFTDQPWLPAIIRDFQTDYLQFVAAKLAVHRPAVDLVRDLLARTNQTVIVDLCSGAGGPALSLAADLAAQGLFPRMILTDRFPHVCAKKPLTEADQTLSFYAEPVDARAVPARLTGLRTCFNAFHHFRPDDAVAVLQDAARARQAIAIFENPDRRWREILGVFFLLPILVLLVTPAIRPFRWSRLLLTYVLPVVLIAMWWDGLISQLRAYSPDELEKLGKAAESATYCWRAGRVRIAPNSGYLTYLIGYPKTCESKPA